MASELSDIREDIRTMSASMTEFHTETAEKLGKILESQSNLKERVDAHGKMLLAHERTISRGKGVISALVGLVTLIEGWFHGVSPHLRGK